MHINFMPAVPLPEDAPERRELKPHEERALKKAQAFSETGRGYAIMHETRPGTIGIVVGSSPIALLAWSQSLPFRGSAKDAHADLALRNHSVGEKFLTWTDETPPLDTILAICTMWWIRDSYPSSIWAYPDELQYTMDEFHQDAKYRLDKPFGISSFKEEINMAPKVMAQRNGNLQFFRYHEKGGHFAAIEQPELLAKDLQDCFTQIWCFSQE
ncbi:hypothetical protein BMF94_3947 [Rhodotorula taiwanensis]|uniref:Epoxide hydrolase n=1 Tax=Rhodotorula taiwanensis TaxID=741276 RepID=A0A2S5B8B6_9BASI|nr:hypothetical protein BMF94_3947 [Rhodotorula taiwanensis]